MVVFKREYFTEVRIRKRVDNHGQGKENCGESVYSEKKQDGHCLT